MKIIITNGSYEFITNKLKSVDLGKWLELLVKSYLKEYYKDITVKVEHTNTQTERISGRRLYSIKANQKSFIDIPQDILFAKDGLPLEREELNTALETLCNDIEGKCQAWFSWETAEF